MSAVVLMYHMVDSPQTEADKRFCRTPKEFESDMQHLADEGYEVLSLSALHACMRGERTWPRKAAAITFDDGVACGYTEALPILRSFSYPASMFIVSSLVDGHNDWAEAHGFSRRRMLRKEEIRELDRSGVDIGSHAATHRRLAALDKESVTRELRQSKNTLEDILGHEVKHLAYPYGSWSPDVKRAATEAGYTLACSTLPGKVRRGDHPMTLKRIEIKGTDSALQFRLKLKFGTQDMPPVSDARRLARQTLEKVGLLQARTPRA